MERSLAGEAAVQAARERKKLKYSDGPEIATVEITGEKPMFLDAPVHSQKLRQ
ncbi:uncharacterized protein V6R79_014740 [Siganus canaliculatus]